MVCAASKRSFGKTKIDIDDDDDDDDEEGMVTCSMEVGYVESC